MQRKLGIECCARRERGASAVEYGLIIALIAVAIILTVTALGGGLDALFQLVVDALPGAGG
jgi:pilus assembly protein Flp/PilA